MSLIYGTGRLPRVVEDGEGFLMAYRDDTGNDYLDFEPVTPVDVLRPEDLAVTILVNSRVGPRATGPMLGDVSDLQPVRAGHGELPVGQII